MHEHHNRQMLSTDDMEGKIIVNFMNFINHWNPQQMSGRVL